MASVKKSQQPPPGLESPAPRVVGSVLQAASLLALAAVYSPLSQLTLAPVYGSIPSSQFHHMATASIALLALTRSQLLSRWIPKKARYYLPVLASGIPVVQWFLFSYSSQLGSTIGPLLTQSFTYFALLLVSAYSASRVLLDARVDQYLRGSLGSTVLGFAAYGFFTVLESKAGFLIAYLFGLSASITRVTLQLAIGAAHAIISPSWLCLLSVPAMLHTVYMNPHFVSSQGNALANSTLHANEWNLIDRAESVTGYISVLEDLQMQYRVLRCDHSLLGGEWLLTEERKRQGLSSSEPIYAVFELLEAVRLVQNPADAKKDSEKSALVVGLGIGTAPKALVAHGIATTVVELDPKVHEFATKYFALPANHTAVLEDAVAWIQRTSETGSTQYDYIIHDVFTGGAEPLPLFTDHFLGNLRSLLTADGVIALNYAGDLESPSTKQVLNTINVAFDRQCRIFRDHHASDAGEGPDDFLNMVIFCNNAPGRDMTFREPVEADYLGSLSRREYLMPKADLELQFPTETEMHEEDVQVLTRENLRAFEKRQVESAKRHWAIMRMVVPGVVWETW